MPRWGMVIDLDKCTACEACIVACRVENNVPMSNQDELPEGRAIFWNQFFATVEEHDGNVHMHAFPRPCQQCENPPCVSVCPVEATYRDAEGRVLVRYDRCIGCRYCMVACPYGARYFNWFESSFARGGELSYNPDVHFDAKGYSVGPQPRPMGVVEKCTFCVHRLEQAKEEGRPIGSDSPDGVLPACVQTCPAEAMFFGNLDDPSSAVSRLSSSKRAFRLLEELGTRPKVYYLAEG